MGHSAASATLSLGSNHLGKTAPEPLDRAGLDPWAGAPDCSGRTSWADGINLAGLAPSLAGWGLAGSPQRAKACRMPEGGAFRPRWRNKPPRRTVGVWTWCCIAITRPQVIFSPLSIFGGAGSSRVRRRGGVRARAPSPAERRGAADREQGLEEAWAFQATMAWGRPG